MRIILADHHRKGLWALRTLIQEEPDLELVGEAVDAEGLLELVNGIAAELVLVDMKLPGSHIKDLILELQAIDPQPVILVMSTNFEDSRRALQAGADAFVSKGDQPEWLLDSLRRYALTTRVNRRTGMDAR